MTQAYGYPTIQALEQIDQDLIQNLQPDDPILKYFPLREVKDDLLRWEQKDIYRGLQQVRGINGALQRVARIGQSSFVAKPGYYGDKEDLDEAELTRRRAIATFGSKMDITDMVRDAQDHLVVREWNRIRLTNWTLATTGAFSVANTDGTVLHTDTFPLQTSTPTIGWGTKATATPLADLRTAKLLGRGHSVDFGSRAMAYANQLTINNLLGNTNASDLGGRRVEGGNTVNALTAFNNIFLENALPTVVAYDDGYYDDAKVFHTFIPDNTLVVFGVRPNDAPVGEYRKTVNANSTSGVGSFMTIDDTLGRDIRHITVGRGHNGGPVIYFPSAILIINV